MPDASLIRSAMSACYTSPQRELLAGLQPMVGLVRCCRLQ